MSTIKIATLNTNGITARTTVGMLADIIRQHDFDLIFAQEVSSTEFFNVRGYNTHLNIGASIRGTAILARSTLNLTNITTLPSGPTMAADYKGIRIINVYTSSGTARRQRTILYHRAAIFVSRRPYRSAHWGRFQLRITPQ